jgi:hypothetical protein
VAAREDQAPPLEDLSPTEATGSCREPPTTGPGEGWREKRDHYAPKRETNSLGCACHALMRGRRERSRLVSIEMEDANEPIREARVVQKLTEEHRSRSKNFDLRT